MSGVAARDEHGLPLGKVALGSRGVDFAEGTG